MKYIKDPKGYLFFLIYIVRTRIYRCCCTGFMRTLLNLKGVKTGKRNYFFGKLKIRRIPLSKIEIGSNNTFRSDSTSNLIGVNHKCILSTHSNNAVIKIGDRCGLSGVTIGASEKIVIGNNVLFGANSVITDFDWHPERYDSGSKPVLINNNVWIGLNSIILKGVEIGENSIIGANSIVTTSIPSNVIAGGNPCKVIKTLSRDDK